MARRTPDQGVQPFELRPGLGFRYFRGMNRSADPGAIPPNQFHLLSNVRLTPAGMIDRPGLVPHYESDESGCITGMIEVDEHGIGFWVTPAGWDHGVTGEFDSTRLANFNEQRVDQRFRRYNRGNTNILGLQEKQPPNQPDQDTGEFPSTSGEVLTGEKTIGYRADFGAIWSSFFKYRKRLIQLGTRTRVKEDEEDEIEQLLCLWELKLPETEEKEVVDYELYADLWLLDPFGFDPEDGWVDHVVSVFGRSQNDLTNAEQINEVLYLSRRDGTVWSFDGTTVRQEVDFGAQYYIRLGVLNGLGVFAIGSTSESEGDAGTALARFQPQPGAAWTAVTLPEANMHVTDLVPWNGSIYIVANKVGGGSVGPPRIYRFTGVSPIPAHIFEFPWVTGFDSGDVLEAGHFFAYRNRIYVTAREDSGFNNWEHYWWQRESDVTWSKTADPIHFNQDWGAELYWILVTANRVITGWLASPEFVTLPGGANHEAIIEYTKFSQLDGPNATVLYVNPDFDVQEQIGRHAIVASAEDTVLNEEEI